MPATMHGRGIFRRPRTIRCAVLAVTLLLAACNWFQLHARAAPASKVSLPEAAVPGRGQRVLVFAPHPDDEVLALGGILYECGRRGAQVTVVYLTNGDGFRLCAAAQYHRWPDQKQMRQLASVRQAEARDALTHLGIAPGNAVFLGYPDRGLSSLWLTNWDSASPFRSPYTAEHEVTSATDFRPGAPFCGEAVLRDLDALLASSRPDFVYYPDSLDDHPDHWAAHCLVQLALERRTAAAGMPRPLARTYLIHRGEWPMPMRSQPSQPLNPPEELRPLDVKWEQASLTAPAIAAKARALAAYRSQQVLSGGFLSAFERRSELLAHWPESGNRFPMARRGLPRWENAGGAGLATPPENARVLSDSTRDRFARARCGAVDFTAIEVEPTSRSVLIAALLRRPAASWATYDLYWKPVDGPAAKLATRRYRLIGYRCEPRTARFEIKGRRLEVTIPNAEMGATRQIMVSAAAWSGPALLDRTPWRLVTVARTGKSSQP